MGYHATEHTLDRAGSRLHYWLAGPAAAPLVVLAHGMTLDHRMFEQQMPVLANTYRVLAWDMRGHGRSQPAGDTFTIDLLVADLLAILEHAGHHQAIMVGHSLGGIVAQELAFRQPERVAGLMAWGCSCITLPPARPLALATRGARPALQLLRLLPYWPLLRLSAERMAERPAVRAQAVALASRIPRALFLQILAALATSLHAEPGYRFTRPLLIAYGERDRYGNPRRAAHAWAARDRQAQVIAIPGAGHNANQDNPAAFNRALLAFLAAL